MRVAIIVTFLRQKPRANRSTLRQDRSHVPVGIRCGAVMGHTSDSRPARLLMALKQSRVSVSCKVHAHVEDGNLATANIILIVLRK